MSARIPPSRVGAAPRRRFSHLAPLRLASVLVKSRSISQSRSFWLPASSDAIALFVAGANVSTEWSEKGLTRRRAPLTPRALPRLEEGARAGPRSAPVSAILNQAWDDARTDAADAVEGGRQGGLTPVAGAETSCGARLTEASLRRYRGPERQAEPVPPIKSPLRVKAYLLLNRGREKTRSTAIAKPVTRHAARRVSSRRRTISPSPDAWTAETVAARRVALPRDQKDAFACPRPSPQNQAAGGGAGGPREDQGGHPNGSPRLANPRRFESHHRSPRVGPLHATGD